MNAAQQFVDACNAGGWILDASANIVTISKRFTPGDMDAFVELDGTYWDVLALAPLKGGSVWGTDGGGIGGYVAVQNGSFRVNKSGTAKRFMADLLKLIGNKRLAVQRRSDDPFHI